MPTFTLPSPYSLSDTGVVTASDLNTFLYNGAAPTTAFNIINGELDGANLAGSATIGPEYTQRGSHVEGFSVAGTANLDYFRDNFANNTEISNVYAEKTNLSMPIPGGSMSFYLKQPRFVRFSWGVMWTCDCVVNADKSRIVLYVNGTDVDAQYRQVGRTLDSSTPTKHEGYRKNRYWSGHHQRSMGQGWHSVSLRVQADSSIGTTRIWARHLDIMSFSL